MDTFNRIFLAILFAVIAIASAVGALAIYNPPVLNALQANALYRQVADFLSANLPLVVFGAILLLAIGTILGILWLRAQFLGTARVVAGGVYELESIRGPGVTDIDYDVIGKAMDSTIESIRGVVKSKTRIYSDEEELVAQTSLNLRRGIDFHDVDNTIRGAIDRAWLDRMGIELVRHDVYISVEKMERRVI